ncbi:MAG: glyoxalase/bleomycin resistance/extradiol dioxygenase family protein, partial [Ignavibacteriales bacterium]|nr:glyoxalase/bleomycin resistance/extradiol dioxygenase family protein [Ignavibacteriales bacterium]
MAKPSTTKKAVKAKPKTAPVNWLAQGYNTLNPILTVKDPATSLAFYKKAFGFKEKLVMRDPNGAIMHAEMFHEGSTIMMGGEQPKQKSFAANHFKGTSMALYAYTPNVDALCKKAKKAGAVCMQEPQDMFWGDRVCILSDIN